MQVKIFTIPIMGGELLTEEMNVFLRSKKVLQVEKHFFSTNQSAAWSFCISYLEGMTSTDKEKVKVDYAKVLDEAGFKRFSKMREIRKRLATEESLPAYAIFTDEELSNMAKIEDLTFAKMKNIKGIGDKKVEKYGQQFLTKTNGEKASHLIEAIADPDNLRLAFWKARKGKSYSSEVEAYRAHLDKNLLELRAEILRGGVKVGVYRYFKVYDPKERQICASAFREQVLHHALMNICHDTFERWQIADSYASRKDKGTYAAIDKAKAHTKRYTFYLKLDVRKFFESIEHGVLKRQLFGLFKDPSVLTIFDAIIDSYQAHPNRGVPIGNLTSQYFANHYLCLLDHFIKEELQIKAYVRYMDDMILWHDDKDTLKQAHQKIKAFIQTELLCKLKPEQLNYTSIGLPFLGYKIFPHTLKLTQRSKQRFIKKIRYLDENYNSGVWSEATCQRRALPLLAFIQHADTKGFRKCIVFGV